ncbi:MAG: hypothetical protein KAT65_21925 [Methanophagales archaeon]|nr:hypothetical protein [Methanophagales archaeon]
MKKDDWIKLFLPIIVSWVTLGGVGGWYYMAIDNTFLSIWIGGTVLLFVILFICMKYFSKPEKEIVLETLRNFINQLISVLDRKVVGFSYSISHEHFELKGSLNPNYDFAHLDIIGKRNLKWIKETIKEYNKLMERMNVNIADYENGKPQDLKAVIIGQLEVAKGLAIGLTDRLKEMQKSIIKKSELGKEALEIENEKGGVGKW